MADDPVITRPNRGQWEIVVPGRPELSASFASREEAVDAGRRVADDLGVGHDVREDADGRDPGETARSGMTQAFDDRPSRAPDDRPS